MVYVLPSEAAFDLRVCAAYQNSSAELRRVVELFGSHLAIPLLAQHLEGVGEHVVDVLYPDHRIDLRNLPAHSSTLVGSSNQYSRSIGASSYSTMAESFASVTSAAFMPQK